MKLIDLNRKVKISILASTDGFIGLVVWIIIGPPLASFLSDPQFSILLFSITQNFIGYLAPMIMTIMYFHFNDMYRSMVRFYEPARHIASILFGSLIFGFSWAGIYLYKVGFLEFSLTLIIILQALIMSIVFFALTSASRLVAKIILNPYKKDREYKSVIIYGAGNSGIELFYLLQSDPTTKVIGFIDDNKDLSGMKIDGVEVFRNIKKIQSLINSYDFVEVFLAIPSINIEQRREIIGRLQSLKVSVRTIPSIHELVGDQKRMDEIQDLSLEDLLPKSRAESITRIDLSNKTIMVTGAGGSIGSEIVRQALSSEPEQLILVDFSEFNLFRIYEESLGLKKTYKSNTKITAILHDISNKKSFEKVASKYTLDYIYHAAAYKHVPMLEISENILTGIKNNILGTLSICEIALANKVKKVVMVSTDKAVRPTNLMGATKRFAEQIVQNFNEMSNETIFSMVRFGNVINSSGSVIPTFLRQISQGGPVTITDLNVTRYFMTIPEASNLVMQAGQMSEGGEVFILDMGDQVKIVELAKRLINLKGYNYTFEENAPGIRIIESGLRAGEKLYEELLISGKEMKTENPKIFKSIEPSPSQEIVDDIDSLKVRINDGNIDGCMQILSKNVHGFIR
ncbi:MAG: nucleoside-diphosphate sugar epimerase/dehydratase [Gammaproteobacteria bacterium]